MTDQTESPVTTEITIQITAPSEAIHLNTKSDLHDDHEQISDKSYAGLSATTAQVDPQVIETKSPHQLSFLAEETPESLPAVLCDDLLITEIEQIPDRLAFKIGDVADMLGIKQYVLRYWETEFDILKPKKASNNQRMYSKKDVENAYLIRKLLHRDRFSIEGARQALKSLKTHVKKEIKQHEYKAMEENKIEHFQSKLEELVLDLRKIKSLFN